MRAPPASFATSWQRAATSGRRAPSRCRRRATEAPPGIPDGADGGGACRRRARPASEFLHPGPQVELLGPGAARLAVEAIVVFGDGVGIEHVVRYSAAASVLDGFGRADAAIDEHVGHVYALRVQFASHALG